MLEESGVWEEAEAGHRWLARFAQLCSGRGAEVWLEGGMSAGECVVGCAVSKLSSEGWPCPGSWRCVHVSRLGAGRGKWHPPALLFLENFPRDPAPPAQTLRLVNKSPFEAPQAFFKPLLVCRTAFLRARTQFPVTLLAFPEPNLLIYKVPGV